MRTLAAWLFGIFVMIAVGLGFMAMGAALGIPSSIEFDGLVTVTYGSGRYSYDVEETSAQTTYGLSSTILSIVIALWAGQAAYHMKIGAKFSRKGWYSYFAWILALVPIVIFSAVSYLAFRHFHSTIASYARMILELAVIALVAWAAHQWYLNRVASLHPGGDE